MTLWPPIILLYLMPTHMASHADVFPAHTFLVGCPLISAIMNIFDMFRTILTDRISHPLASTSLLHDRFHNMTC